MKKSGTYVKKTCQYIMKKVMIMIEFFTICTWFCYVIISTNFWKNKINKKCTTCEKKKHKYLSWKSRIFFGVLAPIYLIIKYHNFLQKKYGFLGVGFLLRRGRGGGLFITPAGTFSDVLQYSSPLPNLHRTIGVDSKNYNSY